jgi:hypothetical protein
LKDILRDLTDIFSSQRLNFQYLDFDLNKWVFNITKGDRNIYE